MKPEDGPPHVRRSRKQETTKTIVHPRFCSVSCQKSDVFLSCVTYSACAILALPRVDRFRDENYVRSRLLLSSTSLVAKRDREKEAIDDRRLHFVKMMLHLTGGLCHRDIGYLSRPFFHRCDTQSYNYKIVRRSDGCKKLQYCV